MITERHYTTIICAYLAMCIILGGASAAGVVANLVLQILALPIMALAAARLVGTGMDTRHRLLLAITAGVLVLPLLQLVPMPPFAWRNLPDRAQVVDGFTALGMALPWLPVSLDPAATLSSWLALLPAAALLLAVLSLESTQRVWIGWTILLAAVVSALFAVAQFVSGGLYLYDITSTGNGVGFFANRNHLATLLLVGLAALTLQLPAARQQRYGNGFRWSTGDLLSLGLLAIFVMGLLVAGSRAGLGLAVPVLITSIGLRMRAHSGESPVRLVAAAGGISAVILAAIAFGPSFTRLSSKMGAFTEDETRFIATRITADAGWDAFPVGTGLGTFDGVFRLVGGNANLGANYINHAHNDYVESWLTGGLPAVLLLLAFLWWFAGAARAGWRARADNAGAVPRIAAVTIAVILAHSIVDYPLRTAAISAIFAVSCALLLDPVRISLRGNPAYPYRHEPTQSPMAALLRMLHPVRS